MLWSVVSLTCLGIFLCIRTGKTCAHTWVLEYKKGLICKYETAGQVLATMRILISGLLEYKQGLICTDETAGQVLATMRMLISGLILCFICHWGGRAGVLGLGLTGRDKCGGEPRAKKI